MAMLFLGALAVPVAAPLPALAEASGKGPVATISITGQGKLSMAPDMAVVTTRVVTPAKTAPEALDENTKAISEVIAEIKKAGIEAKDIQTSGFSIFPRYEQQKGRENQPPAIAGYEVANGVTVNIRDLAKLGPILNAVVQSGANEVNGISFQVSDADKKMDEARKAAVENAKSRASLYAQAAGVKLGKILSISEGGASMPQPLYMRAEKMAFASDGAIPVEAGQETLSASVTIVWELAD
ncbi:SIMPL domain-containing protein [Labrenzia suaedae]|uniref:SIMPL domain-containing protein n=2 Tax=Roseibium litorale TaxID=2803841 RepID=A0ABR9CIK0_9HYPH|nr:SIMPL domain-containing protein [Roseibium litorale]